MTAGAVSAHPERNRYTTKSAAMRKLFPLLLALAPCLLLDGCGRSDRKRIGVVPKAISHSFWQTVHAGAVAAGREAGVEIEWKGPPAETDFSRQIEIVDAMINSRIDGIVLAPAEATSLIGAVERAQNNGIPVTIFDSGLAADSYLSFVSTNNYEAGALAARTLADLVGGKGGVAMVKMVPGASSTMQREQGFEDTIAKEFPDIEIVDFKYCRSDTAQALAVTENMLTAHPDLDGLFASGEPASVGAAKGLRSRNRHDRVRLVAFDFTDALEADIRGGVIRAAMVQEPFQIGYRAVMTVAAALNGETPAKRIDTDIRVVTAANIDSPEIAALLRPDLSAYLD